MGLDPRFIPAGYFELYFVDKDTIGPLSGGIVTFYNDINRTQLKPVYQISGNPPNYVYTVLPNPIILNGDGTFSDNLGNDIIPYFFPYEGIPSDNNNTIELYYITVQNSLGVPQFTREGVPNLTASDIVSSDITNFIPNGQFLLHNNGQSQVLDTTSVPGTNILQVAQGGWTFEVNSTSSSTNSVTFQSFNGFVNPLPTGSPEFACRVSCSVPSAGDIKKDLCVNFYDVNKFASSVNPPSNPQEYTLYFEGQSNSSGAVNVDFYVVKFFGIGGSSTSSIHKATISIGTSYAQYQTVFDFGDNVGTNITENDFVQIAIRFPLNAIFDISLTNFVLSLNSINISSFPTETNNEMISKSLSYLPTPDPDGFDLYLPITYGPEGFYFDRTQIGKVFYTLNQNPGIGELEANGQTLVYNNYSTDGIPYARLGNVLYSLTTSIAGNPPPYGTGSGFVTSYQLTNNPTGAIRFHTNQASTPLASSTVSVSPALPFTINNDHFATNYSINSYLNSNNSIDCQQLVTDGMDVSKFTSGTSGLIVTVTKNANLIKGTFSVSGFINVTSSLAGKYFTFQSVLGLTKINYYVWFKVDGSGADPAPSGYTGIQVNLYSYYLAIDFACAVRESISGFQLTTLITVSGSSVPPGSYFTFSTSIGNYFAWYKVNGSGTQPVITGNPILIEISSSDTASQVALKTATAMNRVSYAVPDFRGNFLRVMDNGAGVDFSRRSGLISYVYGDQIPTLEFDANHSHNHDPSTLTITGQVSGSGTNLYASIFSNGGLVTQYSNLINGLTGYSGFNETRPINQYVNCVIKY